MLFPLAAFLSAGVSNRIPSTFTPSAGLGFRTLERNYVQTFKAQMNSIPDY